jgi:hypothetical protein
MHFSLSAASSDAVLRWVIEQPIRTVAEAKTVKASTLTPSPFCLYQPTTRRPPHIMMSVPHMAKVMRTPRKVPMSARPCPWSSANLSPGQTVQGEGNRHIGRDYMKGAPDRSRRQISGKPRRRGRQQGSPLWSGHPPRQDRSRTPPLFVCPRCHCALQNAPGTILRDYPTATLH